MNERDKETVKLVATMLGNLAVVAMGIAFFEGKIQLLSAATFFGGMALITIRSLR